VTIRHYSSSHKHCLHSQLIQVVDATWYFSLGILYGFQVYVPSLQAVLLAGEFLLVHLRGRYILDDLYDQYLLYS